MIQVHSSEFEVNKNSYILTDFLNWGGQYNWSVCGYDQNNLVIECFNNNFFLSVNCLIIIQII